MGNCTRRLAIWAPEQMTMSGVGASATIGKTSNFVRECLPSGHDVALGDDGARSSMEQKSEYFSPRVEEMMRSKSQSSSAVEHEIEHSKVHWSEVLGLSEASKDDDYEEVNRENEEVFVELMNDPQWMHHQRGHFFRKWEAHWRLGRKIAEGGQAEIFEVLDEDGNINDAFLMKVFKRGSRPSDLKKQWPCGILCQEAGKCITYRGVMLDDRRFAFQMMRCWGDLRKLIDQAMQEKNNQGPPFPYEWNGTTLLAKDIMLEIAYAMRLVHEASIVHRDLKAANILLFSCIVPAIFVADYECSIGVVGTGFWRAPKILLALKNRSAIDFNEKMDVYSYGMTCFEGELEARPTSYDLVIEGQRPKLPSGLDVLLKDLIEGCWNPIPSERPSFKEILYVLSTSSLGI